MSQLRAFNLLVIDDDPLVHQTLKMLAPPQWKIFSVQKLELLSFDRFYHAALVDMHLDSSRPEKIQGTKVLTSLREKHPQTDLIAISGDLNPELMEDCLKAGAQKFLAKPFSQEELLMTLEKIQALWELRSLETQSSRFKWLGKSAAAQNVLRVLSSLKGEFKTILIEGETGTGKEVVARLLNQQESVRPFISVNVASIPEHLFESEFFGHIKGSFTGADQNKIGLCEAANGGDLFLDEIEALSLPHQAKLLRFLESGEVRKVGAKESTQVSCRVISASNRPLKKMIEEKSFREDLYFRLCSHSITLPPLRDRSEDIPELAEYFLKEEGPRRNKSWSPEALSSLQKYKWPGNVRELKRIVEQIALTCPLPLIREKDVLSLLGSPHVDVQSSEVDLNLGLATLLENYEQSVIRMALTQQSDVKAVANLLKISVSNLYKKIDDYNLKEHLK